MMRVAPRASATLEKPLVYSMRPGESQENGPVHRMLGRFPQLLDFKPVLARTCLTVFKNGSYTGLVTQPTRAAVLFLFGAFVVAWPDASSAQAIQRSLYVSVLNQAG